MLQFPPELNLILYCVRGQKPEDFNLSQDFDWQFFIKLVQKHKLESLVHKNLKNIVSNPPPRVVRILRNLTIKTHLHNMEQMKTLQELVTEFNKHALKVLFVKGLCVNALYPMEKYQRPARDIDFIITWQDVAKTISLVENLGFELIQKKYKKSQGSIDFRHKKTGILLELHWNLWSKREEIPSNFTNLWHNREYIKIHNTKVATLNHLTHISYLCYHGAGHFWYRLFWLLDVHFLMKNKNIDWAKVINNAKTHGTLPTLFVASRLSAKLFKTKIPPGLFINSNRKIQNMFQDVMQVLKKNPYGTELYPQNFKEKIQRVGWKLKIKSKYRLRTLIKLILIR